MSISHIRARHEVRVVHGTTGQPLPFEARLTSSPPVGWTLQMKRSTAVVIARDGAPDPATPLVLSVTLSDASLAGRLSRSQAEVTLDRPAIVERFDPAPMTLIVDLVDEDGRPVTGKAVRTVGSDGSAVSLPESDIPGSYASAPRSWPSTFHPFDLQVDGTLLKKSGLDFNRPTTRIRVVDTT